jgi:hypothetical protein
VAAEESLTWTNMEIIRYFLPVDFVTTQVGHLMKVEVKP